MQESKSSFIDSGDTPPIKLSVLDESTEGDDELRREMIEAFLSDLNKSFIIIDHTLK